MSSSLTNVQALSLPDLPADGICSNSPKIDVKTIGVNETTSVLYFYGDTRAQSQPFDPARNSILGVVLDVLLVKRGKPGAIGKTAWQGDRTHLLVRLATPTPTLHYTLCLPAYNGQHHYRSLLGKLTQVDMQATVVKLEAEQGKSLGVTFFRVETVNSDGKTLPVIASSIDASPADLLIAVNACRRNLGLPPLPDEWANPTSQTPSPVINCEAS